MPPRQEQPDVKMSQKLGVGITGQPALVLKPMAASFGFEAYVASWLALPNVVSASRHATLARAAIIHNSKFEIKRQFTIQGLHLKVTMLRTGNMESFMVISEHQYRNVESQHEGFAYLFWYTSSNAFTSTHLP
jgi:hypothetical protein